MDSVDLDNWYEKAIAAGKGFKSDIEREEYIASLGDVEKHPMFCQNTEDLEGNPLTEAIRSLKEEDKTLKELAIMYKDEGNEWQKKPTKKNLKEAYDRYSHALEFIRKAELPQEDDLKLSGFASVFERNELKSIIYSNRALTSLTNKNYGSCRKDADEAITAWPANSKAHYRKCKALQSLGKYSEGLQACNTALAALTNVVNTTTSSNSSTAESHIDKFVVSILEIQTQCKKILETAAKKTQLIQQKLNSKWMEAWAVTQSLDVRLGDWSDSAVGSTQIDDVWTLLPRRDPESVLPVVPMVLLYPEVGQMDTVQACSTTDLVIDHLSVMLPGGGNDEPLPWDSRREYRVSTVAIYVLLCEGVVRTADTRADWLEMCKTRLAILNGTSSGDNVPEATSREKYSLPSPSILEVDIHCTLLSIMTIKKYVLAGGLLSLLTYVRGSKAEQTFVAVSKREGRFMGILQPSGVVIMESR